MKLLKGNNREVCCMALFFSCLMVGLVVIAVWKRNYKKETIDNILSEGNKKGMVTVFISNGTVDL